MFGVDKGVTELGDAVGGKRVDSKCKRSDI